MMNSEAGIMEESRSDTVSLYLELRGTNPPLSVSCKVKSNQQGWANKDHPW